MFQLPLEMHAVIRIKPKRICWLSVLKPDVVYFWNLK